MNITSLRFQSRVDIPRVVTQNHHQSYRQRLQQASLTGNAIGCSKNY